MEQVMGKFVSHRKALGLKMLYKTNQVEEQLQTSGYCNTPDEKWWEPEVRNISEDRKDVIEIRRELFWWNQQGITDYRAI